MAVVGSLFENLCRCVCSGPIPSIHCGGDSSSVSQQQKQQQQQQPPSGGLSSMASEHAHNIAHRAQQRRAQAMADRVEEETDYDPSSQEESAGGYHGAQAMGTRIGGSGFVAARTAKILPTLNTLDSFNTLQGEGGANAGGVGCAAAPSAVAAAAAAAAAAIPVAKGLSELVLGGTKTGMVGSSMAADARTTAFQAGAGAVDLGRGVAAAAVVAMRGAAKNVDCSSPIFDPKRQPQRGGAYNVPAAVSTDASGSENGFDDNNNVSCVNYGAAVVSAVAVSAGSPTPPPPSPHPPLPPAGGDPTDERARKALASAAAVAARRGAAIASRAHVGGDDAYEKADQEALARARHEAAKAVQRCKSKVRSSRSHSSSKSSLGVSRVGKRKADIFRSRANRTTGGNGGQGDNAAGGSGSTRRDDDVDGCGGGTHTPPIGQSRPQSAFLCYSGGGDQYRPSDEDISPFMVTRMMLCFANPIRSSESNMDGGSGADGISPLSPAADLGGRPKMESEPRQVSSTSNNRIEQDWDSDNREEDASSITDEPDDSAAAGASGQHPVIRTIKDDLDDLEQEVWEMRRANNNIDNDDYTQVTEGENTITSTLYFDAQLKKFVETRPPVPLFPQYRIDVEREGREGELSRVIRSGSHKTLSMLQVWKSGLGRGDGAGSAARAADAGHSSRRSALDEIQIRTTMNHHHHHHRSGPEQSSAHRGTGVGDGGEAGGYTTVVSGDEDDDREDSRYEGNGRRGETQTKYSVNI